MPDTPYPSPAGERAPAGLDSTRASIARVYDAALGGKDNYEADRQVLDAVLEVAPGMIDLARMNRAWLERVVRYLAGMVGIDQFLDIGAGLPTAYNTHEIAQGENREARVVYVDNDPMCNAHGRVLLETNEETLFLPGDLTVPGTLLDHPAIVHHLDTARPIAVILGAVLHHIDDEQDPAGIVGRYIDALPPGSAVAITHFWDPDDGTEAHRLAQEVQRRYLEKGLGTGWFRTRERIASFFGDLDLVEPGLVELDDWWPSGPTVCSRAIEQRLMLGGVGYKRRGHVLRLV